MIGISSGNGCSHLSVPVTASLCWSVSLKALIKSTDSKETVGDCGDGKISRSQNKVVLGTC